MQDVKMSPDDRMNEKIEEIWNWNSTVPPAVERCIHELFIEQANARPDAPAICAWDGELTYGELDELSTKLAGHLVHLGVKAEDIVPLCFEKSMWTVVAMLAVLKAGGAFAPLDPEHPRSRQEDILQQTKARVVLTSAQHSTLYSDRIVVVVSEASIQDLPSTANSARSAAGSSQAAYVIFTSGSTGVPKGVVLEHRAASTSCLGHGKAFRFSSHTRALQFATYTFDACITEILTTLLYGGCVCIPSEGSRRNELAQVISHMNVNWALLTPSVVRLLDPSTVPSLKVLVLGGEQISATVWERWEGQGVHTMNAYGPAECCVTCCVFSDTQGFASGLIGKAVASVSWVVDPDNHDKLAPFGSTGELLVEGPILARGYLSDANKTAASFIHDPAWLLQGSDRHAGRRGRLYKTGDLVRYESDGNLVYVGRKDGQVKIRGQRVELGEIESVLSSQEEVSDAIVVLQRRNAREAQLAAFVTLSLDNAVVDAHVNTWEERFTSDVYSSVNTLRSDLIGRDFIGWTAMEDGSVIDRREMNEWLDDTIDTILSNGQPENILEIGSGTGMILFNLGTVFESYVGLDPSMAAVQFIETTAKSIPALAGKVRMHEATAADISLFSKSITADLVIMNSVIQYFPSQDYLVKVVEDLLETKGVKTLFFGDVRSHALQKQFLATRALRVAGQNASKADVLRIMADMEQADMELLVDPAFFTALPSRLPHLVRHVEILPKKMRATNELSCYRYAAVVHVRTRGQQLHQLRRVSHDSWINFTESKLERQSLVQRLKHVTDSRVVAVSNIPHSKTAFSRCLLRSLEDTGETTAKEEDWLLSVERSAHQLRSLSAMDLVDLAREANCRVEISWSRQYSQHGGFDAVFHRTPSTDGSPRTVFQFPDDHHEGRPNGVTSKPLEEQVWRKVQRKLREALQARIPSYMIPRWITKLDTIPLTKSGKRDRKALEAYISAEKLSPSAGRQPTSEGERTMQQLWAQVLNIEPESIGVDDSFFRLGGDSIAAMQLVAEARKRDVQLTVEDIFRHPKLVHQAGLSSRAVEHSAGSIAAFSLLGPSVDAAHIRKEVAAACSVDVHSVEDVYPCSPLQEGLVSLTSKNAGDYIMRYVLEMRDEIDEATFRAAWERVVQSAAILRTRIVHSSGLGLVQAVIGDDVQWVQAEGLAEYLEQDKAASMGLGEPLGRYALVREPHATKRWFVWTAHHALFDGWSMPRILASAETAYGGGGVLAQEPDYQAFIRYLGQQDQEAAAAYWQTSLADCTAGPFPPLPSTVQQPVADGTVEYQCPPLAKAASDTTTSTLIRAAWAIIASRYTGSEDVVFGATLTGRNAPVAGIETMVGPTIATVPVRVRTPRDQAVSAFLEALQQQAMEMIPFEQTGLHRIAKMGADGQRACDFQTLLVVQPGDDVLGSKGLLGKWQGYQEVRDFATYALTIQCTLKPDGIGMTASFDSRVTEQWVVERMLAQFSFVMQQLAGADPSAKVADMDTLTPDDKQQLWMWNSEVPPPVDRCIHELFIEQANARPDAPAICAWDGETTYGELTYSELDELSTKLAGHLVELGVGPEDMVPLCFEKSMWTVIAMLAVLKAGGAFAPLDPEHPRSRQEDILQQTKARVVLTSAQHSTLWVGSDRTAVIVSEASMQDLPSTAARSAARPSHAAYVIFTSGSTGVPKGVVMEHEAASTSCLGHGRAFGFSSHTRALQFASYIFDACITEIFTTLLYGGCICIPPEGRRNEIAQAINCMNVNWAFLTPSVARLLDPGTVLPLTTLVLGGEQVSVTDWERWQGRVRTMNGYGPTECCVFCISFTSTPQDWKSGVIGKAVASASVGWVVDPDNHDKLAPLGSTGELLVEGPILARGYLNDAEKTADAFIYDPAWLLQGNDKHGRRGRLYKTGDLVRYQSDGSLVYVGRKDGQVKIRGQRVELGEIEYHLSECMPEARQVAVEVIAREKEKAIVAAFVQLDESTRNALLAVSKTARKDEAAAQVIFQAEVDDKLAERLPSYMVPEVYFAVARLPMTTSGKTDRRRLREMGASFSVQQLAELRTQSQGPKRQPLTEKEKTLQQLWARVLNIRPESIGLDDSFFRLGGDSITAMQLSAAARSIQIHLSTRDVFRRKTIAELARYSISSKSLPLASMGEDAVNTPFGLTPMQELYLRLEPTGRASFDQSFFLELRTQVTLESLRLALRTLVQRHSMLRARFNQAAGSGWQQYVSDAADASFTVQHVRPRDAADLTQAILQNRCRLDIERGPVMTAVLCDTAEHQSLFMAIHHLVIDLVSWRVLLEELEDLLLGRPLSSASPSTTFQSWRALQAEYVAKDADAGDATEETAGPSQLSYWGATSDHTPYAPTTAEHFVLGSETTSALLGDCNEAFRTRPHELMLAALIHSFAAVFPDRNPPPIFNETHGREPWDDSIDISRTVGWFTSMFPVQVPGGMRGSLLGVIRATKDCMRSFKHNGRSYFASRLANEETARSFASIFPVEVVFNYEGAYQQLERGGSLFKSLPLPDDCAPASAAEAARMSLFTVSVVIVDGCAQVTVAHSGVMKRQTQVAEWIQRYEATLIEMAGLLQGRSPQWSLTDLSLPFVSYRDLDRFRDDTLAELGLRPEDIEDVCPCSPMQEGILASQSRDPTAYRVCSIFEAVPAPNARVDCARLQQAWRAVVRRHSLLRALLVDNVPGSSGTTHVVLRDPQPSISVFQAAGVAVGPELFRARYSPADQQANGLQHHLSICQLGDEKVYLCLDINHAIIDAHSTSIIMRDLQMAYSADLRPPGPPFRNFISYLKQQSQEEAGRYWAKHLDGIEPCHFPSMAEGAAESPRDERVQVPGLDAGVIHAFCRAQETTPATVIQTAWALVLARYAGSAVPCFGVLSSGRDAPIDDVEDMFGPLIAMLPFRVRLDRHTTVQEVLRSVQSDYTNALRYQAFSLASVHNMLQLGRTALFNTALTLQRVEDARPGEIQEVAFQFQDGQDPTEYDIALAAAYSNTTIDIDITFRRSCMDAAQAKRLAANLGMAIGAITAAPNSRVQDLELTTDEDVRQMWAWNDEVPPPVDRCIHELFVEQANARPDAPAICAWDGEATYGELDKMSTKLAGHLVHLGVKTEDIVPLCFEKSMWTVVAMLAVLKAGGAFAPLDPEHPRSRQEEMLEQTKAKVVLTSAQHSTLWAGSDRTAVVVSEASMQDLPSTASSAHSARPSHAAYVIFTSGSTGVPKGVVLEHRAASTSCLGHGRAFGFSSHTRALQFATYTFDACITEIFTTLVYGGCVCVPSEADRSNDLSNGINALAVNFANLTPTVARLLHPDQVPLVGTLALLGEQVTHTDWERWGGRVRQINSYGPTECAVVCSAYIGSVDDTCKSGLIGKAVASVGWVVDPDNHDRLASLGSTGELLIEGPILARGYLNDAEKTAASFIHDPAWLLQGSDKHAGRRGRLYKTGDLVRYDESDGNLVYVGRKDGQVKIRGQRVELSEIEHHLSECMPEARQVAVEVIAPAREKERAMVAAFVQLDESTRDVQQPQVIFPAEADDKLAGRLPSHMVPEVYFAVGRLPTTTSGKTDRRRLREIGASFSVQQLAELRTQSQGPKRQPSTEKEKMLQQLWARVLDINAHSIGLDDSFFRLGGDSIAAMKLVAEARKEGLALAVADVFRTTQLGHLADQTGRPRDNALSSIPRVAHSGPVAQSFAQGRLWFLEELHPALEWYLMPFAVRITGALRLDALEAALQAIERRHGTLRTTFSTNEGIAVQEVHPFRAKELNIVSLDNEQDLFDALQRDQTTPFDLRSEPGWRVCIYRLDGHNHVLSIVMHHIISDGWSQDVFQRELSTLYSAAIRGQDPISRLPPLSIQYHEFSVWQRQQEQVEGHQRQLDYWTTELQTSRPAEFLSDYPRPATLSGKAGTHQLKIDGQLYSRLQQFCRARGVTLFVVLLAAFRATHYRLTGQDDATIGAPNANRDHWELKDIIGFFVNMQCLRVRVGDGSFEELIEQVRTVVVASLDNQDVPFEQIVSRLQRDRDLSRHPIVQVAFAVHSQKDLGKLSLEGLEAEAVHGSITSRFDLECHFLPEQEGLQGYIIFSTDLYAAETISSLVSVFQSILNKCLDEPETKIASTPLLTTKAYTQLDQLSLIQIEQTPYPRESGVVDLFREQAAAHPSRVAVKDSSGEMTYAQLDESSDNLARWLAGHLLAPETLIGVFADRSCQAIVALLGILKAGLAYLPFDVKIPGARMDTILSSTEGSRLVLVGDGVQPPKLSLDNVEFVHIAEVLTKSASSQSAVKQSDALVKSSATNLAYVMFTSGSTGQPKGVMVEHRGIVRLVKDGNLARLLPPCGAMAHVSNLAFDASTWEIYAALLNGMTLACIDTMQVLDQTATSRIFTEWDVQAAFLTTALFRQYTIECPEMLTALAMLCVGGERLDQTHLLEFMKHFTGKFVHVYGPTENTTFSTAFCVPKTESFVNSVPIGRAISNSGAYVMDQEQRPVPLGVIGELVLTGDGLARGYTDSARNVDRFVTVTIGEKTMRAYRTGDFARYRPTDGQLEFFGRIDGQVKIRGHRVELGEVENVLCSHRSVRDAVVVSSQSDNDDQKLVGYVTLEEGSVVPEEQLGDAGQSQHVDGWEDRFDSETYAPIDDLRPEAIGRDFVGWTSMYDGSEIDKVEMNEWLDDTMRTIYTAVDGRPENVLEIGSGTGMILFNLLEGLQSYVGLDPSGRAVRFIEEAARSIPSLADKVSMYKATAADISHMELAKSVDFVVLNSVVQYFPSQEYLFKVIQGLLKLKGVKTMFFGDVRSYALHREFLASRALRMAGDRASKKDIRRMVGDMEQVERELLVDPGFFTALPSRLPELVEHVEILPKRMKATNELSCYRYAAVVHVKAGGPEREVQHIGHDEWVDFEEHKLNRQSLLQQLESLSSSSTVAISNIPHSKTIFSRGILGTLDNSKAGELDQREWVASIRQAVEQTPSLSAVDLVELAEEADCRVEISWSRQYSQHGGLDAVFYQCQPETKKSRVIFQFPTDHANRPQHSFSSKPLRQQLVKEVQQQLEEALRAQLPEYMIPQSINVLENFPINENGKVDRSTLARRMEHKTTNQRSIRQPSTEAERTTQRLWARVLNIEPETIGVDDSFFRLGGDSIAAMKLVAEARKEGIQLSVADIFRNPKLVALAGLDYRYSNDVVEEIPAFSLLGDLTDLTQIRQEVAASCSVDASLIEDIYPCSPLQEGLMSLTSKRAGDYIMQAVLELREDTDEEAFRAAWDQVVQSTQVLRTRILLHSKLGLLQAVMTESIQWSQADGLDDYLERDREASMGLGEHLVRYALVREDNGHKRWFVWTIHHSLYDGWSLPRITEAVKNVYGGGVARIQPGFQAFIKYLGQQDKEAAVEYWQTTLADCQATPFPPPPSAVQQLVADTTVQYLCPPLLEEFSDTTKSTLVRAAWAIVASRYTNSDDVIFGTVVTGRNAPVAGIEDILGPTIATVPVRVHVPSDQAISAYLKALQQQATDMIPFEQTGLQQIAKMGPGARHACNFQTLLVVQPADDGLVDDGMLGMWRGSSELQNFTTYALVLQCILAPQGVQMVASFDPRAIEQQQVEKMLSQLSFVMQQLAGANDHTVIGDIEMLTPEERQLLWTWNSEVPPAVERCVHDLFTEQARARPNAPAICAWDGETTYGELDELSTKLAGHLVELGVGPEDMVPLCFEKSMWTVVAMLAVLKAGGAFVPLDPEHPRSRQEEMLEQTKAKVVLTSVQHSTLWVGSDRTAVVVSEASMQDLPSTATGSSARSAARTGHAAYVIFTSGSTGVPKGVVLEHRAISTGCLGHGRAFGFSSHTRTLQFATYIFDACIMEIFTTLVYGGCVCVPSEGSRRNELAQVINHMNVNQAILTPSVARLLDPGTVPSLKVLVFGGEQMSVTAWDRWEGHVHTINGYGPAECCVTCCAFLDTQGFASGLIGKAVASVCWVVDPDNHDRLASLGSTGELLVEGPIMARGYLNDAEKTTASFIHDPAWLLQGSDKHVGRRGRLYKTGDLVRYESNGNLVYVGRKDNQVKIRGQRVELSEIEHHLSECMPEARQVAVEVIAPAGEKEKAMVAAFVQLDKSARNALLADSKIAGKDEAAAQVIFPAEVDDKLAGLLPSHMVPEVYFTVARLPITTSGKTDRRRLREMGASLSAQQLAEMRASNQGPKRTPSTEAERTMQRLWARVLNIEPETIGVDDSFFRLGGDSIAAMKLVAEVRKEGLHLTVADLIRNPWLDTLAGQIIVPQVNSDNKADVALESRVSSSLVIDWDMETAPPESSAAPKLSNVPVPKDKPKVVVLTGCTGLLGKHLLSALLRLRSIRKVICLAVRRLSERIVTKQLPPPDDRVIYYEGDLIQPRFGLSESKWAAIFSETDAVIHIGADTSHIKYYSALRGVNVESTKQLVRSCLQHMVPIHYVSSASIAMSAELDFATATSCTKTGFTPPPDGAQGYLCSKWVCESMLERVHAKYGLQVVISRPSAIMREGDDHMLEGARFDLMNEFLNYMHKTQRVPQLENTAGAFDLVSVETCCNDIIRALLQDTSDDRRITYVNSVSDMIIPKAEIASIGLSKVGKAYEVLAAKEWRKTAVAAGMHPAVAALV